MRGPLVSAKVAVLGVLIVGGSSLASASAHQPVVASRAHNTTVADRSPTVRRPGYGTLSSISGRSGRTSSTSVSVSVASVTQTPDGGRIYTYNLPDGSVETVPVPPANFDPLTASASTLAEYAFPARPTDSSRLATWQAAMSSYSSDTPPPSSFPYLEGSSIRYAGCPPPGYSCNWGGYYAGTAGSGQNTYVGIDGESPAPSIVNTSCTLNGVTLNGAIWVGLSDAEQGGTLAQEGIAWCGPPHGGLQWTPFTEYLTGSHDTGAQYFCSQTTWYIPQGHTVLMEMSYQQSPKLLSYWMEDITSGNTHQCQYTTPSWFTFSGATADWITEQQAITNYGLPNYDTFSWADAITALSSNGSWVSLASQPHQRVITGCSGSDTQVPGAIGSDGKSFPMDWKAYRYSC